MTPSIKGWADFYVIVGAAAGALIGLMFVVVALVSSTRTHTQSAPMRAFASPTIVHFSTVLLLSGVLTIPRHTRASLGILLLAIGGAGLIYASRVVARLKSQDSYAPDAGDWAWYVWVPAAAYASVAVSGFSVWAAPTRALYIVASGAMALMLIGIHNAWDSAVHLVATTSDEPR